MAMPPKRYRYPSPMEERKYRYKMLDLGIPITDRTCGVLNNRIFVWRERGGNIMEVIEKTDDLRYDNIRNHPYYGYMMRRRIYNPSPYDDEYGDEYESESYEAEYKKGTRGPCWEGYTYVGPTKYSKGSCVKNAEEYETQFTPSQELSDYTVGDLVSSSAIEGYEPLKYSVVGNRAETFFGDITTEPITVYRRMGWKQYYDGLEMGYLHPMKTRMQLRPDENIGGTWGMGQPQIWAARKPNFSSPLKHLSGSEAKQLFEIDIPIGTRFVDGWSGIQIFDSIPIENVRPFYMGDEEEYTHMAENEPPKTSKGLIVYPQRMAELIRDGDKTMIVKDKPLDLAGKRYTIVAKRKGYAYVQLGNMRVLTLPKFRDLRDEHLITAKERAQYFKGKRRLYAWPVKVLREFDKPYPTNAPLRPQDIAPKLKTYATETFEAPSVRLPTYRPIINQLQWNTDYLVNNDFLDEHFIDGGILNRSDWELIDWSNPHSAIQNRKMDLMRQTRLARRRKSIRRRKKELEEMGFFNKAEVIY